MPCAPPQWDKMKEVASRDLREANMRIMRQFASEALKASVSSDDVPAGSTVPPAETLPSPPDAPPSSSGSAGSRPSGGAPPETA